jgi:hypothetical protein
MILEAPKIPLLLVANFPTRTCEVKPALLIVPLNVGP